MNVLAVKCKKVNYLRRVKTHNWLCSPSFGCTCTEVKWAQEYNLNLKLSKESIVDWNSKGNYTILLQIPDGNMRLYFCLDEWIQVQGEIPTSINLLEDFETIEWNKDSGVYRTKQYIEIT